MERRFEVLVKEVVRSLVLVDLNVFLGFVSVVMKIN